MGYLAEIPGHRVGRGAGNTQGLIENEAQKDIGAMGQKYSG